MSIASPPTPTNSPPPHPLRSRSRRHSNPKPVSPIDYHPISVANVTKNSLFTYSSQSSLADEGVQPPTTLPPTPPPADIPEPKTPERKNTGGSSDDVGESPRRSLRRMRGSVSEKRRVSTGSDPFLDDIGPLQVRRESLSLHHPKALRGSPKSAYLEEERRKAAESGQEVSAPEESPPPKLRRVRRRSVSNSKKNTPSKPREGKIRRSSTTGQEHSSATTSDGSPKLRQSRRRRSINESPDGKARVTDKAGRKVTPWPTPRMSFATTAPDSPRDTVTGSVTPPPEPGSSGTSSPIDSSNNSGSATAITASSSARKPQPPPRSSSITRTSPPPQKSAPVIIHEPAAGPSTPQKPHLLPALNLIPATPQALGAAAEKEKQLGAQRRWPEPIPILIPEADDPQPPERPSLAEIPENVRESKLHPWWQPKVWRREDGEIREEGERAEDVAPTTTKLVRTDTATSRKSKRIMGTRLVIEFVGWRTLRDVVRRKKAKTSSA